MSSQNTTLECRACDPKVIQIARNVTEHFDGLIVRSPRGERHIYRPFDIEVRSDRVRVSDYKGNRATIRYKDTGMSPADVIAKLHECKCGGGDGISAGYEVVSELPEFIAPGVQVLYNGTMWRGLAEGESSLAAGTPWPVKGYKEILVNYTVNPDQEIASVNSVVSDQENLEPVFYDAGFAPSILVSADITDRKIFGFGSMTNIHEGDGQTLALQYVTFEGGFTVIHFTGWSGNMDSEHFANIHIKIYPPTN